MKTTSKESRLGRFSYLLNGGARPRRSPMFLIALVLVVLLSFAGVVSADDYYMGAAPTPAKDGVVTGGVDVQFADTWQTDNPNGVDTTWANFTLSGRPANSVLAFARFYIVPYCGNMTADYFGNMSADIYHNNTQLYQLSKNQSLALSYDNTSGASYATVSSPLKNLSRTTSDYVAVYDLSPGILPYYSDNFVNVSIKTYNLTGRFDGRIKSAHIIYGWNALTLPPWNYTYYRINDGNDPITKYIGTYTGNTTKFNNVTVTNTYTANLFVEFVAGNSTSGPAYGKYWFNGQDFTPGVGYSPTYWTASKYAGFNHWTWNQGSGISTNPSNILNYSRTNDYYKMIFSTFTIRF